MVRHHTLKYHLNSLDREDVYEIAKFLSLKNRSKMSKEELNDAVYNSIKNDDGLVKILNSLGQKSLEVISIVLQFDGNIDYETLKKKYPDTNRSLNVNLNKAIRKGALFELYVEHDDDIYIQIPKDLIGLYRGYIYSIEQKMSFVDFLSNMLKKWQLIEIAEHLGIAHSGSKNEISNRIKNKASPEEVLKILDVESLREICGEMGLPKKGKKEELIDRIINNIESVKTKRYKVKRKPSVDKQEKSDRKSPFYIELYEVMNKDLTFKIRSKTKEKDIEDQLFQFLRARFPRHSLETQVKTSDKGKIDMAFIREGIGIELKYNPNRSRLQRLVQQVQEYRQDFKRIIVFIVTEDRNVTTVNKYKKRIETIKGCKVIIYKIN